MVARQRLAPRDPDLERLRIRDEEDVERRTLKPLGEWRSDDGLVLWWKVPADGPPHIGVPMGPDWPWRSPDEPSLYWIPIPPPIEQTPEGRAAEDRRKVHAIADDVYDQWPYTACGVEDWAERDLAVEMGRFGRIDPSKVTCRRCLRAMARWGDRGRRQS